MKCSCQSIINNASVCGFLPTLHLCFSTDRGWSFRTEAHLMEFSWVKLKGLGTGGCFLTCFFFFVYSFPKKKKKSKQTENKHVVNMLYGGKQWSQDSLWQRGVTPLQTTDIFSKCRQTAIVIIFSCKNNRYASIRDGNDCYRQSRNIGWIFPLSDSPDFAHACIYLYIPWSPAVPRWPPVQKVWGTPAPIARGTQEGGCLLWHLPTFAFHLQLPLKHKPGEAARCSSDHPQQDESGCAAMFVLADLFRCFKVIYSDLQKVQAHWSILNLQLNFLC